MLLVNVIKEMFAISNINILWILWKKAGNIA